MGARWLINLRPEEGTTEMRSVLLDSTAGGDLVEAGEVLEYARLRWPGDVLDVVGPDGRSYLLCSIPPWYSDRMLPPAQDST